MTATSHSVSWAKLCLCVAGWIAASTSFGGFDANAFVCLPSAEAVKEGDPTAWPSWTLRAPGFEGKKCWYASTRGAAHDHPNLPAHEPAVAVRAPREPEPAVVIRKPREPEAAVVIRKPREPEAAVVIRKPREPDVTGSATEFDRARTSATELDSTFEDRFLADAQLPSARFQGAGRSRN
jgi:hypothetical protein